MKAPGSRGRTRMVLWGAAFALVLPLAATAAAAPRNLFLVGGQLSANGDSAYLGSLIPFAGSRLGRGWFVRPWLQYTTYRYVGGPGVVKAHVPGVAFGFGHAWSGAGWSRVLSIAPGWQNTHLSPNDPGARNRGGRAFLLVQVELRRNLSPRLAGDLIANYSIGPNQYWSRARLGYAFTPRFSFGPAAGYQGGPDYHIWRAGLFTGWGLARHLRLDIGAGYLKSSGVRGVGYVSLSLGMGY